MKRPEPAFLPDEKAVLAALDLYSANFDLMIATRQTLVSRRTRSAFSELRACVGRHAPWAAPELNGVLLALTEALELVWAEPGALERVCTEHGREVQSFRDFLGTARAPWG